MDEVASFRDTRTNVAAEKAEQPQDEENDNNGPQHEISPSILLNHQSVNHFTGDPQPVKRGKTIARTTQTRSGISMS